MTLSLSQAHFIFISEKKPGIFRPFKK